MAHEVMIYGDFLEGAQQSELQFLRLKAFSLNTDQLWDNGSLSAAYMAQFWESFFSERPKKLRADIRDSIRYVAAELIGNAVKYSAEPDFVIEITLDPHTPEFRLVVTNSVKPAEARVYQQFIEQLLANDPATLYIDQMEKNAVDHSWQSCIGFLTIMLDYGGHLAWKFEADKNSEKQIAKTMVRMPISKNFLR